MRDEPIFNFSPGFIDTLSAPYSPPDFPITRSEALFMLSYGGQDCLGELLRLLGVWGAILEDKEILKHQKIAVRDLHDENEPCEGSCNYLPLTALDLSCYFSGFPKLCEWLQCTCHIAFYERFPDEIQNEARYLDGNWMDRFSRDGHLQQNVALVNLLLSDLTRLVERATYHFTVDEFWCLLQGRLEKAAEDSAREYAGDRISQDEHSAHDRIKLLLSLQREGVLDACPSKQLSEHEFEEAAENSYRPILSFLYSMLSSQAILSVEDVYNAFIERMPRSALQRLPWPVLQSQSQTWRPSDISPTAGRDNAAEPSLLENFSPTVQANISGGDENGAPYPNVKRNSSIPLNRAALLKVSLRYIGKDFSPIADQIRCPINLYKKFPKIFLEPLSKMKPSRITRAKKDMEGEGYEFDNGYELKPESFARLEKEVDGNLKHLKRAAKKLKKCNAGKP